LTDEKTLVEALKKGDRAAFEEIFHLYYKQIYSFCYSFLHQKEDAENITQDVFVKLWIKRASLELWIKRASLDCEKSFSGFLLTMTRHLSLNHIRAAINRQILMQESLHDKPAVYNQVEEKVSYNEIKQALEQLTNQLPPRRKEIFLLSREEGLSHLEISKRLNISVHTVESQMTKALKFIRKSLDRFITVFVLLLSFL